MGAHLVIAGGNVDNLEIYSEFAKLSGNGMERIAIIPSASLDSSQALMRTFDMFKKSGIKEDRLVAIKVDPDKKEDGWKSSGDDYDSFDFLQGVGGVWFTGGDQVKIIRSLQREDGSDTKLLEKIRQILAWKGVIGGTSAGAAVMGDIMIGGGTSFGALSMPHHWDYIDYRNNPELEDKGALLIMRGLGFFKEGIIDQHFDKRNRLGRLLEILFDQKTIRGYGIAENTAMIYDIERSTIKCVGSGEVIIVDISEAQRVKIGNYSKISKVKIVCLKSNDTYNIWEDKICVDSLEQSFSGKSQDNCGFWARGIIDPEIDFSSVKERIILDCKSRILPFYGQGQLQYINDDINQEKQGAYLMLLHSIQAHDTEDIKAGRSYAPIIMDMLPVFLEYDHPKEDAQ